ncbi:DUF6036 family nucleotidyltransferase [Paenibacillus polymyxa]|uniref:DUF6036 domain-containing protein n=1 Tax=Paenibacillus polymyxa (strain SC2) TaxID=886882 RepID=E3ELA1_PAEPS|nr:DUF6036 family nucleotidyltransferase [Paenibacillus polymyxa]ADO59933.1 hypothetical protein PPSC2_28510 [Paenibacillus polymyxa SC2]WPQ59845.1 DUF6036 family nucleotidyltransferase [Paenibacillus polymyxa]
MNTVNEVMENFLMADQFIKQVFPNLDRLELVVVGGASFLLKGFDNKFTLDIDTITQLDSDVLDYLESFSINNASSEVITLSETYYERTVALPSQCKVLDLRMLCNEDLVLAKVGRSKRSDIDDILETGILYETNLELLNTIATELESKNYDNFKNKWEDFKRTVLYSFE